MEEDDLLKALYELQKMCKELDKMSQEELLEIIQKCKNSSRLPEGKNYKYGKEN